jgi:hypothetical protein
LEQKHGCWDETGEGSAVNFHPDEKNSEGGNCGKRHSRERRRGRVRNGSIRASYCAALQAFIINTIVVTIQTAVTQLTTLSSFLRDISFTLLQYFRHNFSNLCSLAD